MDASLFGYAYVVLDPLLNTVRESAGIWKEPETRYSINRLEGMALLKALRAVLALAQYIKTSAVNIELKLGLLN